MMAQLGFYNYVECRKINSLWTKAFIWLLLWSWSFALADRQGYRTAYGCEGESLSITCEAGHVIDVIRANYGRFSITICNSHGNTEWSVNCASPKTFRVLTDTCTGNPSCTIEASTNKFGDGCPGTLKYLEAHYKCLSGSSTTTTTTARPLPSWLPKGPVWFPPSLSDHTSKSASRSLDYSPAIKPSTVSFKKLPSTTQRSTSVENLVPKTTPLSIAPSVDVTTPTKLSIKSTLAPAASFDQITDDIEITTVELTTTKPNGLSTTVEPSLGLNVNDKSYDVAWCPPTFTRGLMWNWTKTENVAELPCPGGATGSASRKCISGDWSDPPDLSDCRSAWLTALEKRGRPNTQDSALAVAIDLAKVTGSKALYGGDLLAAARLVKRLSTRMMKDVSSVFPEPHQKKALVTEFLMSALSTVSSLLKAGMMGPWGDLSERERREAVTEIMVGLEEATFLLAHCLDEDTQSALLESHVLASARSIRADGSQVQFPSLEDQAEEWAFPDSVILPPEVIYENSDGTSTRVVFLAYRHLEDLLTPTNNSVSSRSRGRKAAYVVNSRVVSASLGHGRHIQISELSKPVLLTFSLLRHENVSNPICAFWDYTTHDWSDEGCLVLGFNKSHVTCKCNHLTNFAVLMEESSPISAASLQLFSPIRILTFVGCLVCLVCVAGAILLFSLFKGMSSTRTYVHRHVCVCLFIAELAFLVGIWRTDMPVLCGLTAGTLLYSVLSTFAWMFAEGVYIYISATHLLEFECLSLRWWHYVVTYGCPLLVVSGAAIADPLSFGTMQHCWLATDNYIILALVVPVLVLLAMQLVLLGASLLHTCKFNSDGTLKTKEISLLTSTRSWMRNTAISSVLMVVTWVFGLLLLHQPTVAIAATFCTANALLGIFTFMYYCIINQKFVPTLCNANENAPPSITHYAGSNYIVGSQEGSCTPPASAITRLGGHSSLSAPLAENISYKSFSRDSGHGGSEQEDSPRTPWVYQQRYDLRTKTLGGHGKLMAPSEQRVLIPNSYSFSLLPNTTSPSAILVDRRNRPLSPPWGNHHHHHHHTYTEIDPVYEEIVGNRGEAIQVSDLSDEDNNKRVGSQLRGRLQQSPRGVAQYSPIEVVQLSPRSANHQQSPRGGPFYQSQLSGENQYFLSEEALRNFNSASEQKLSEDLVRHYLSNENLMTVAVLNGEQVVCRLSSPTRQPGPQGGFLSPGGVGSRNVGQVTPSSDSPQRQYSAI